MTGRSELHLLIPGRLEQRTGGYIYDAEMVLGLRRLGWQVEVHSLHGRFPDVDDRARASAGRALEQIPDGVPVLIDSLAIPALHRRELPHLNRTRPVALVHHLTSDESGINNLTYKTLQESEMEVISRCSGVIVTSDFTGQQLRGLGIPAGRISVVVPGVVPAEPATGPSAGEPPQLLCVGSLIPRKGHEVLVAALARLSTRPWSCVCAGSLDRDPLFVDEVMRAVEQEGLSERIRFLGECDPHHLSEVYARSSIFVLPSRHEGYGMAVSEALARGLPVVTTAAGALRDTVPADAGIFVPVGDDQALAEAIEGLLSEEGSRGSRRAEMAAAALRHAAGYPTWEQQVDRFAQALLELAGPEPGRMGRPSGVPGEQRSSA